MTQNTKSIHNMTMSEIDTLVGELRCEIINKDERIAELTAPQRGVFLPHYIRGYESRDDINYVLIPLNKSDLSELLMPTGGSTSIVCDLEDDSGALVDIDSLPEEDKANLLQYVLNHFKSVLDSTNQYSTIHTNTIAAHYEDNFIHKTCIDGVRKWYRTYDRIISDTISVQVMMTINVEREYKSSIKESDLINLTRSTAEQVIYAEAPKLEFTDFDIDDDTITVVN